jgi:hypothetical protein
MSSGKRRRREQAVGVKEISYQAEDLCIFMK